jgi:prophage maintenance system killer protein
VKIHKLTEAQVIGINAWVCRIGGNSHNVLRPGGAGSALSSAFYPGSAPFQHGGIAGIAGALCFYLCQSHTFQDGNKRTAIEAATTFMRLNGHDLCYPRNGTSSALVDLIEICARGERTKEQLMVWFELHKVPKP